MSHTHTDHPGGRSELRLAVARPGAPAEDLGLVAAHYDSRLRELLWLLVGRPRAAMRLRAAHRAWRAAHTPASAPAGR